MALIELKNLPDKTTPINADNLNYNFNELDTEIKDLKQNIEDNSVYSTKETFTGKYWVDGKKIYKRVFELGVLGNDSPTTYELQENFKHLVTSTFYLSSSNTTVTLPIMNNGYITNVYAICNGNGAIEIVAERQNKDQYSEWSVNAILEYTKLID